MYHQLFSEIKNCIFAAGLENNQTANDVLWSLCLGVVLNGTITTDVAATVYMPLVSESFAILTAPHEPEIFKLKSTTALDAD